METKIPSEADIIAARDKHYSELLVYNEKSICNKCGCKDITTKCQKTSSFGNWWSTNDVDRALYEKSAYVVLKRSCTRCSHYWLEKPLDLIPPSSDDTFPCLDQEVPFPETPAQCTCTIKETALTNMLLLFVKRLCPVHGKFWKP